MADLNYTIPTDTNGRNVALQYVWDSNTLSWVRASVNSSSGGNGLVGTDGLGGTSTYTTLLDEPSSTVTYVGEAAVGSSVASSVWRIKKITTSGAVTTIGYASGTTSFDKIWNDRASYSYS